MKITVDHGSGPEYVDVAASDLSTDQVKIYADMGIEEAREEHKNRVGIDIYKNPEDYTSEDVQFYLNWKKNNTPEKQDRIIKETSDEGSDE